MAERAALEVMPIVDRAAFMVSRSRLARGVGPRLAEALGVPCPEPCRFGMSDGGGPLLLAYAPCQWLVLLPAAEAERARIAMQKALSGVTAHVFDFDGGLEGISAGGPGAPGLMAAASTVDFSADAFPTGMGVRTRFVHQSALVLRRDDSPTFEIFYDGSLGWSMEQWLRTTLGLIPSTG